MTTIIQSTASKLKRSQEGYLMLDHRDSPGITDAQVNAAQMPVGSGRGLFEAPTYTCPHCTRVVVMNPSRIRAREFCTKCNHHICDQCSAIMATTGQCVTFQQIIEEVQEAASKGSDPNSLASVQQLVNANP